MLLAETREPDCAVWIDGGTAAVSARPFSFENPPSYAVPNVTSLNYEPYVKGNFIPEGEEPVWRFGPSSMHPGVVGHLAGDGSAHYLSDEIEVKLYAALVTRAGGEVTDSFDAE
jgi:hypothetical protein